MTVDEQDSTRSGETRVTTEDRASGGRGGWVQGSGTGDTSEINGLENGYPQLVGVFGGRDSRRVQE